MISLHLAVAHLRHRIWTYLTFLLSSTFAVWLFSLYSAILDHPEFQHALPRPYLTGATWFVGLFTATLILQLHASQLADSRNRIRQLLLQGMRPLQLIMTLHLESSLLALIVLGLGIGLSAIFARLFFLGLGLLADLPNPPLFAFPLSAVLRTCLLFGLSFLLCILYTHWAIRRAAITTGGRSGGRLAVALPRAASQLLLSIILLLLAYLSLLVIPYSASVVQTSLWAALLLVTGTWLLFARGLPALLANLRQRKAAALDGVDLITLSLLTQRLHHSGRLLMLSAVLITAVLGATAFSLRRLLGGGGIAEAYVLFLLGFIGLMVLLAVGSLLYLQLLSDTPQARARARSLRQLGVSHRDLLEIFSAQASLVFGLPALVGAANGSFLLTALVRATGADGEWIWDSWVFLIYVLLHALFYLFARSRYLQIVVGPSPRASAAVLSVEGTRALHRPRTLRKGLFFQIGGLAALAGGVLFFAGLPVTIYLRIMMIPAGPFTFNNLVWISALGFIVAQSALTRRIAPWLVRLVLYPGVVGTVLILFGALPPLNALWGVLPFGVMLLALGTSVVGVYQLLTGGSGLPLRGLAALLSGLLMASLPVTDLRMDSPQGLLLFSQFGLNWAWTGLHMLSEDRFTETPAPAVLERAGAALSMTGAALFAFGLPAIAIAGFYPARPAVLWIVGGACLSLMAGLLAYLRTLSGWVWPVALLPGAVGTLLVLMEVPRLSIARDAVLNVGFYLVGASLFLVGLSRMLFRQERRPALMIPLLLGGLAPLPLILWASSLKDAAEPFQLLFGVGWVVAGARILFARSAAR